MNKENFIKNKNNRKNCNELKYKVIGDENIDNVNLGGNEQILVNDVNLNKNMKNEEQNDDINNEDFEKQKICENFVEIDQLYEEALLKNFDNNKRYYDNFKGEKFMEMTLKK